MKRFKYQSLCIFLLLAISSFWFEAKASNPPASQADCAKGQTFKPAYEDKEASCVPSSTAKAEATDHKIDGKYTAAELEACLGDAEKCKDADMQTAAGNYFTLKKQANDRNPSGKCLCCEHQHRLFNSSRSRQRALRIG